MSYDVLDSYLLQDPLHGDLHQNRKWRLSHRGHRILGISVKSSTRPSPPSAPTIKIFTISYKDIIKYILTNAAVGNDDSIIPLKSLAIFSSKLFSFFSFFNAVRTVFWLIWSMRVPNIISVSLRCWYDECCLRSCLLEPLIEWFCGNSLSSLHTCVYI